MCKRLLLVALLGLGFAPSSASAQFQNHSLGLEIGYAGVPGEIGIGPGPALGVDATLYLDAGLEATARTLLSAGELVVRQQRALGLMPAVGLRYLLVEEQARPYVGMELAYLHFFSEGSVPEWLALAANGGVEVFVSSSVALSAQLEYQRLLALNAAGHNAWIGLLRVASYF